jgi:hypothetical protein
VCKKLMCNRRMSYFPRKGKLCISLLADTFKVISMCKGSVILKLTNQYSDSTYILNLCPAVYVV